MSPPLNDAVRARLQYICDYLFCGDVNSFARVLGVRPRTLTACLQPAQKLSIDFLARVIQRTDVRADWLLLGVAPILNAAADPVVVPQLAAFMLARTAQSTYPVFTDFLIPPPSRRLDPVWYPKCRATKATDVVAHLIYTARGHKKPVLLFVDLPAAQDSRKLITQLLQSNVVTGLIYTGRALKKEITGTPTLGLAALAKVGAQAGVGFGETVQRWGGVTRRSPLRLAFQQRIPFAADIVLDEMIVDLGPVPASAETGAAFGACAYVDLLVFAAQCQSLRNTGGVLLVLGTPDRVLGRLMTVLPRLPVPVPPPGAFSIVFFGTRLPDESCTLLRTLGGDARFVKGDPEQVAEEMRLSCTKIFDGKIDDCENDSTDS